MKFKRWILPVISGVLFALSMPGAGIGFLIFVTFILLFYSIKDSDPKEAAKLAFGGGFVGGLVLYYWVYALWDWISVFTIAVHIILAIYTGIFWGIFGYLFAWLRDRIPQILLVLVLPSIWMMLEYARSLTIFGFPWGQAADALTMDAMLEFIQIASITGIWGVTFVVVLVSYLFFLTLERADPNYYLAGPAVLVVVLVFGMYTTINDPVDMERFEIAMIQPSIPQRERSDPLNLPRFMSIYDELLTKVEFRSAIHEDPVDLVVLPESALPTFILSHPDTREFFANWSARLRSPVMLGTFTNLNNEVYNSVAYVNENGPTNNIYNKIQLVPFSTEYFPAIDLLKSAGVGRVFPLLERLGRITPGDEFSPIQTDLGLIGTPICFETLFPHVSRQLVRNGAGVIISVTNDAWFHNTWALPQHFAKGVYRAVENRRYFIQTANSGISGIIDPTGKVEERSSIEDRSVIFGQIALRDNETFYTRHGDLIIYAGLAFLILGLGVSILPRRQPDQH